MTTFSQLLDAVGDKFSMTDEEIADQLDCDRTYLSKLRNGKQNPGPKITRRLQSLLDDGPSADGGTAFGGSVERFLEEARHLAKRAGTDVESFLERLLDSHGLEVALELKKERELAESVLEKAVEISIKPQPKRP